MSRQSNLLQIWGNKDSMNLNSMILTNIQASIYFKQTLFELKTYHEVIDEIYYRVKHLEPWEKGSRRTQGLTGMCGGVRGVGGGGIVSTAFCLLYKLYTLKLTRKQVMGLIEHQDSPYIRALGFMYVRYTQNPQDLFYWYCDYLDDEEELDVKAGGGMTMTIGQMLRQWLIRLEWFDTLFPRIPIPIQNEIMSQLRDRYGHRMDADGNVAPVSGSVRKRGATPEIDDTIESSGAHRRKGGRSVSKSRSRSRSRNRSRSRERGSGGGGGGGGGKRSRSRSPKRKKSHRSKSRERHERDKKKEAPKKEEKKERARSSSPKRTVPRGRSKSRSRSRDSSHRHHRDKHSHKSSSSGNGNSSGSHHKHHKRDREKSEKANNHHHRSKSRSRSPAAPRSSRSASIGGESEPGEIRSGSDKRERKRSRDRD